MKNISILYLFLLIIFQANAQVKIGGTNETISNSSILQLESDKKALVITRINNLNLIENPVVGMIVYDNNENCFKKYGNNKWSSCLSTENLGMNYMKIAFSGVFDKKFGDGVHDYIYGEVLCNDGRVWLNNNLGANYSNVNHPNFDFLKQAQSITDFNAYGSLFQWGRAADGHEIINWTSSTSGTFSNADHSSVLMNIPNHKKYISNSGVGDDWRLTNDDTLWTGISSVNNPCPENYKVPTRAEFEQYILSEQITNANQAFNTNLKLTKPGKVVHQKVLHETGSEAYYATSTINNNNVVVLLLKKTNELNLEFLNNYKSHGYSVRCIKNKID